MKSIQMKLTVTILVIFVVAMATLGGLNYWKSRSIVMEDITTNMKKTATDSAEEIGDLVAQPGFELGPLAVFQAGIRGQGFLPLGDGGFQIEHGHHPI